MKEISPGVAAAIVVVVLLIAGGVWFFASKGPGGVPSTGEAGRSDPMFSGSSPLFKQKGATRPGAPGGTPPPAQPASTGGQ
jgi:hypothetical protein